MQDPPPVRVLLLRPPAGWARSSAGPSSSIISESSEERPSIAPRWPHSESLGPGCATVTAWPAVRRRVALRSSIAEVAFRADGCLPSGGRARSESVSASCAMVGWALSIGLIDLPFSHWTHFHVTFKHPSESESRMGRLVLNLIVTSSKLTVPPLPPSDPVWRQLILLEVAFIWNLATVTMPPPISKYASISKYFEVLRYRSYFDIVVQHFDIVVQHFDIEATKKVRYRSCFDIEAACFDIWCQNLRALISKCMYFDIGI
jgi:hypothetical protein